MQFNRSIVLSVAGLDPSGGAGLLADIKTFEQHKVYGLGVSTAQTLQTETAFFSIRWERDEHILEAIDKMLSHYAVKAVKIGIVQSIASLYKIVSGIRSFNKTIKIVFDPVIRSTTDFNFWKEGVDENLLHEVLQRIDLITPNIKEASQLVPGADAMQAAQRVSQHCSVLLKGGHNKEEPGVDYLFNHEGILKLEPHASNVFPKHGSGCVLAAAIAANLSLDQNMETACRNAKTFTEKFLSSNPSLLGYYVS